MPKITFKAHGKTVSFTASGKRARAKSKKVYVTKKPHKGAVRKISAKGLAKMRANGRAMFKKNGLAKYAAAVKKDKVSRSRKGRITKIRIR